MHSIPIKRIAAAVLASTAFLLIPACAGDSEAEQIASARSYLEKNDPKSATIQLKTVLQKNPQSGEARFLLGQALFNGGEVGAAVLELEKAHALNYNADLLLPWLAKAMTVAGQARKVTDQLAEVKLGSPVAAAELQTALAFAYGAQGMRDRSQAAVDAALQLDPKNTTARVQQARLAGLRGATDEALALVDGVLATDPQRLDAWQLKGEMLLGGKRDTQGATAAFNAALAVQPRFLPAHLALISLWLRNKDIPKFRAQVGALRKALPESAETRFYEAHLALLDGDLKSARQGAQQLLRAAPESARVLQLAGSIELRSGALLLAESHLGKAVQLAPQLPAARLLLAQTYLRSGQTGKALPVLQPLLSRANPDAETLALAAEVHLQDGNPAKAETYFLLAAKADPGNAKAQAALALAQISKGNTEAGLAQLESLAAQGPDTLADLALISARMRRNEPDLALKAIDRLQGKLADKPLPFFLRGRLLAQRKDWAGARASFEKALAVDPVYFPAVANLAAIDVAENKPDDARKRFESLLAREPANSRALLAVAELRQRAGAAPAEIGGLLADAVKKSPTEVAPRLALINHFLGLNNAPAARAAAQEAVAAMPENVQLLDALGRAQMAAGDGQLAISSFGKVAAAQPTNPLPLLQLADAYAKNKDSAAASRTLRQALAVSPNFLPAQGALIQLAVTDKRFDDAVAVAREVQKQRPTEPVGHVFEADIRALQKQWDPAIAAARAALQRSRTTELAVRLHSVHLAAGRAADAERFALEWERERPADAQFQLHLASKALGRKDFAGAEARFLKVLALKPDDAGVLNNLAWLMTQQGKPGAVSFAQRAMERAPDRTAFMDTLASALAAEGQLPKALEWQRKAVAKAPEDPFYRLNLAKLLIKSGDKSAARTELESLAKLGGRFPAHAEVAQLLKSP